MIDRENFAKLGKWAGFVGTFTLIGGILQVLSIVGIIAGIIMIVLAVKLLRTKSSAKAIAGFSGEMSPDELNKMVNDLRVYFQINGVLIIIGLIFAVLVIIAVAIASFSGIIPWNEIIQFEYTG